MPEAPNTTVINANGTWAQKLDLSLSPPGFLKLASAATNATVTLRTVSGKKYAVVSFAVDAKAPSGVPYSISGYIDEQNMVDKVETKIDDNIIGDTPVEQSYSGYQDFGGVKFPTRIVQTRAGLAWTDLTVTDVKANTPAPAPPASPRRRDCTSCRRRGARPGTTRPGRSPSPGPGSPGRWRPTPLSAMMRGRGARSGGRVMPRVHTRSAPAHRPPPGLLPPAAAPGGATGPGPAPDAAGLRPRDASAAVHRRSPPEAPGAPFDAKR